MMDESMEIVVNRQEIDLKDEAKKQFHIAVVESLQCVKKPAKDFMVCLVDYLVDHVITWFDSKLSS